MWASYEPLKYNRTYSYPGWALAIGMCMAFVSMTCIPGYVAGRLLLASGTLKQVGTLFSKYYNEIALGWLVN